MEKALTLQKVVENCRVTLYLEISVTIKRDDTIIHKERHLINKT